MEHLIFSLDATVPIFLLMVVNYFLKCIGFCFIASLISILGVVGIVKGIKFTLIMWLLILNNFAWI